MQVFFIFTINSILCTRKLRHRGVKQFAQGHIAKLAEELGSNPSRELLTTHSDVDNNNRYQLQELTLNYTHWAMYGLYSIILFPSSEQPYGVGTNIIPIFR